MFEQKWTTKTVRQIWPSAWHFRRHLTSPFPLPKETKPERLGVYIVSEHCLFLTKERKKLFSSKMSTWAPKTQIFTQIPNLKFRKNLPRKCYYEKLLFAIFSKDLFICALYLYFFCGFGIGNLCFLVPIMTYLKKKKFYYILGEICSSRKLYVWGHERQATYAQRCWEGGGGCDFSSKVPCTVSNLPKNLCRNGIKIYRTPSAFQLSDSRRLG